MFRPDSHDSGNRSVMKHPKTQIRVLESRNSLFLVLDAWEMSSTYHAYVAQNTVSLYSLLMLHVLMLHICT